GVRQEPRDPEGRGGAVHRGPAAPVRQRGRRGGAVRHGGDRAPRHAGPLISPLTPISRDTLPREVKRRHLGTAPDTWPECSAGDPVRGVASRSRGAFGGKRASGGHVGVAPRDAVTGDDTGGRTG